MASLGIELIGFVAGFLGIIAWGPQLKEVWIRHHHEAISLPTFSLVSFSLILWLIYGIIIESKAMIVANILTLSVICALILGVLRLRRSQVTD